MINLFLRTIILYLLIIFLMRITGKRQIGQLEITELVTAFMVSELASSPITDNTIPLLYGIIPAVVLVSLEVFFSFVAIKSKKFRKILSGQAIPLVYKGKISKKQMNETRITMQELVSAVRCSGMSAVSQVDYAFLEPNGTISVIPKPEEAPPSSNDLNISVAKKGIEHPVIIDGKICDNALDVIHKNKNWLMKKLVSLGFSSEKEVFYMGINDLGEIFVCPVDQNKEG